MTAADPSQGQTTAGLALDGEAGAWWWMLLVKCYHSCVQWLGCSWRLMCVVCRVWSLTRWVFEFAFRQALIQRKVSVVLASVNPDQVTSAFVAINSGRRVLCLSRRCVCPRLYGNAESNCLDRQHRILSLASGCTHRVAAFLRCIAVWPVSPWRGRMLAGHAAHYRDTASW